MNESAYRHPVRPGGHTPHHYGPNVHILADAWALSLLAQLGSPQTGTRDFHRLLRSAYRRLVHALSNELAVHQTREPTRMAALVPGAAYEGAVIDPRQPVVIVDIARAGIVPSDVLQQELLAVIEDAHLRVDHLYMQRAVDDAGRVCGIDLTGSKIGGSVEQAVVFIPDPMGATGGSIAHVVDYYRRVVPGTAKRFVVAHLMVTPEYLRRMAADYPDVVVYTLRVDRGLSAAEVLNSELGASDAERGLNDTQYIVPGAGGLGELINNAFV